MHADNTSLCAILEILYAKFSPQALWIVERRIVEKREEKYLSTKAVENFWISHTGDVEKKPLSL